MAENNARAGSRRTRVRPYVGCDVETRRLRVFRSDVTPTDETHGDRFAYAIGPFRTVRAARLMAEVGMNNPHLVTVEQAERMAKRLAKQ